MTSYWLMKSEPETFSINDLQRVVIEPWDGIRNYQARNFLRTMKKGDLAFFYHSNTKVAGIVGIMSIHQEAYPDPTQFNPDSQYYDPKSSINNPRWYLVDVKFQQKWKDTLSLTKLKTLPTLDDCQLVKKGNRLSIISLSEEQWHSILSEAKNQQLFD